MLLLIPLMLLLLLEQTLLLMDQRPNLSLCQSYVIFVAIVDVSANDVADTINAVVAIGTNQLLLALAIVHGFRYKMSSFSTRHTYARPFNDFTFKMIPSGRRNDEAEAGLY